MPIKTVRRKKQRTNLIAIDSEREGTIQPSPSALTSGEAVNVSADTAVDGPERDVALSNNDVPHPVKSALKAFLDDLESIYTSAPTSLLAIGFVQGLAQHNVYKLARSAGLTKTDQKIKIGRELAVRLHRARARTEAADRAALIAPRTFLVSMVSQFDVFLARLIRALILYRPDILSTSERKLSYSEMLSFSSLEGARESILEAEIESVLRKNLSEQFLWFEAKFDVKLRAELPAWTKLVELTQRRNLFVHADGLVNKQYLAVCQANGVETSTFTIGEALHLDPAYLSTVRDILTEVSIKLSQVLWRKADGASLEEAETHLNNLALDSLQNHRYDLAINLFDFAFMKPMRRASKELELMLIVNRANAYKLAGKMTKCAELIGTEDWSAYDKQFRLARAVLVGTQKEIVRLMKEIGNSGSPSIHSYREWPLFASIRSEPFFTETFRSIFDEDLILAAPLDLEVPLTTEISPTTFNAQEVIGAFKEIFSEGEMRGWLGEFIKVMKTHN